MIAILDFIKSRWGIEEREYQWWSITSLLFTECCGHPL